ncbi:hypothetical protein [Halapricum hydrolyticum]|uniref:Uncharacterized protein n=1 Tax=Halapricum hydrolyticum TaxID=2979991 RepID=A0AAE3ID92_9EURY|nr:hypothetical protein [Halapricum hydrolyticum]MCU4719666.1 hypothetical protein [Halapricum hydrolyticum]MCU4726305.1 hypothetical protein [Halapricum hydrolyticum]
MSNASPTGGESLRKSLGFGLATVRATIVPTVRFVGFWTAVVLPFVYLPLLFTGLDGATTYAFVALLVAHVVSLLLGREYGR